MGMVAMLFCIAIMQTHNGNAQENNWVTYKSLGFRFSVPQNWEGKEIEGMYLLTNNEDNGFVMISTWPFTDMDKAKAQLANGIKKETSFFLAPAEPIETIDTNRLQGKFSGLINYSPVIAYLVLLRGKQQQTVLIVSAIDKKNYSEKQLLVAKEVAESFEFFNPQMPSISDELKDLLNDTKLIYTTGSPDSGIDQDESFDNNSYFGYREKTTINLCRKGLFTYLSFKTGNGSAAFAAGNKTLSGKWQVIKNNKGYAVLQLQFEDGDFLEFDIEYLEGKVYLDGYKYLRTPLSTNENTLICN